MLECIISPPRIFDDKTSEHVEALDSLVSEMRTDCPYKLIDLFKPAPSISKSALANMHSPLDGRRSYLEDALRGEFGSIRGEGSYRKLDA